VQLRGGTGIKTPRFRHLQKVQDGKNTVINRHWAGSPKGTWDGALQVTAIGSTEGADRKFPFWAVFDPLQGIVSSPLSSASFDLKPSWNNLGTTSDRLDLE
jgi:hypothetical protein